MFSHPVKPHPWPLPTHSTRPHRDTGNAVSEFGMFLGCEAFRMCGLKGIRAVLRRAASQCVLIAGLPSTGCPAGRDGSCQAAGSLSGCGWIPGVPVRTRDGHCQPPGVPGGVRVCPCEAGPDFGTLPAEGAWPRAWLGAGQ